MGKSKPLRLPKTVKVKAKAKAKAKEETGLRHTENNGMVAAVSIDMQLISRRRLKRGV